MQIAARAYADYLATGARINATFGALFLARSSLAGGGPGIELGLASLSEALARADTTGERLWEAELHRMRGELLAHAGAGNRPASADRDEAEACLLRALETARQQEAKIFELRAAMSLARLPGRRGRSRKDARATLAEIFGRFAEGLETPDLRAARTLLGELG
jgi:predicted ATPase